MHHDQYLETEVMTAPPHRLHLMVIEGAVRHAQRAATALEQGDFETAHFALNHSREFVGELVSGLNEQQAPELVGQLGSLFFFAFRRLVEADLNHDRQAVDDALRVLTMHRETWLALSEKLQEDVAGDEEAAALQPKRQPTAPPESAPVDEGTGRSWLT